MKRDVDAAEIEREMVRAIQAMYPAEHQALENWGKWSRDRRGIFPAENPPPSAVYDTFSREEWDKQGYGEAAKDAVSDERLGAADRKAERAEEEPYDEKLGYELDCRIHAAGGLPDFLRTIVRIAYVTREVPEDQFHVIANCPRSTFRERLEDCLIFVGRFL